MNLKATAHNIAESVRAVISAHGYSIIAKDGAEIRLEDVAREAGNNAAQVLAFARDEEASKRGATARALPLWLICRERRTSAGVATEQLGLRLHAATADRACEVARQLGIGVGMKLVAIQESA